MFDINQLRIGDEIYFGNCRDGRGDHGAYVEILAINRKSLVCAETTWSYRSGKQWRLEAGQTIARVSREPFRALNWGVLLENGQIRYS